MRLGVAGADCPLGSDIGGHLVKVSLRVPNQFQPFEAHEAQKYFLGDIVQVGGAYCSAAAQKLTQGRSPLAEPVGKAGSRIAVTHWPSLCSPGQVVRPDETTCRTPIGRLLMAYRDVSDVISNWPVWIPRNFTQVRR